MKNKQPVSIIWTITLFSLPMINVVAQELPVSGLVIDTVVCTASAQSSEWGMNGAAVFCSPAWLGG